MARSLQSEVSEMNAPIFRPIQLVTLGFLATVVVALLVGVGLSLWELRRLQETHEHLERMDDFGRAHLRVERRLVAIVRSDDAPTALPQLTGPIEELISTSHFLHPETPRRLEAFRTGLVQAIPAGRAAIFESITSFHEIANAEHEREQQLLSDLHHQTDARLELQLAAVIALFAVGVVLVPVTRRRFIKPLDAFGRQLTQLASGDFTPASLDEVDPLVLPLHRNLNDLASRLQELEAQHHAHTESLEEEVRAATQALLEQQHSLTRAERLAATGELAASVAHELRNPLAGIQMTLSNLLRDLEDPDLRERVELVLDEVGRLTQLLNRLLDASRHSPEPAREVMLSEVVGEILDLTRYQIPASVHLESWIEAGLTCRVPEDRLRQALLNLILNSATALGEDGGKVRIEAVRDGEQVRISVLDDGPGFPPTLLEDGIRPFFSTHQRGTGLGLAMVQRFARDAGGSVELSGLDPHGARVSLLVPTGTGSDRETCGSPDLGLALASRQATRSGIQASLAWHSWPTPCC
jgi:C4-dicarboxylate-specific signal transduction histidine kinase